MAKTRKTKRASARTGRTAPSTAKPKRTVQSKVKRPAPPALGEAALREQLVEILRGGHAHATYEDVVANLPAELRGRRPNGAPYSPWMILEHIRIAFWDILEFSRNPSHVSPEFPSEYWPTDPVPPNPDAWTDSVARYARDREAFERLVRDPASDLFTPFPHGTGQTLVREVLVAATHTSYHIGELVVLRRLLGAWPG